MTVISNLVTSCFFRKILENGTKLANLVLYRERAVTNAVRKIIANIQIFYCWNHLRQDLKRWLETHNASRDDKGVYREDFQTLLHSNSKEEFNTNEAELKLFWTDLMVEYFDKHYRNDILNHAVKLLLHE